MSLRKIALGVVVSLLLVGLVAVWGALRHSDLGATAMGRSVIARALVNPDAADITWRRGGELVRNLPPLVMVECEWMRPVGACCVAYFQGVEYEVHILPKGGGYEIELRQLPAPDFGPSRGPLA